jgi:hypothetical protein
VEWRSVGISNYNSSKLNVKAGRFTNNQLVIVWQDQRIDDGIYAQNLYDDGTIGPLVVPALQSLSGNVTLYPNPSVDFPTLEINGMNGQHVNVSLKGLLENQIFSTTVFVNADRNAMKLQMPYDISPGIYIVTVESDVQKSVLRFIKQ